MIMFGGADPSDLTGKLYDICKTLHPKMKDVEFHFLTGFAYENKDRIITDPENNIFVHHDAKRVSSYMKKADLLEGVDPSPMSEEEYSTEYLELKLSVKVVRDVEEAVDHINRFGSHHTDAIITEDEAAAGYFMQMVDSAGVYQNASTRFADGFRYGFGAEVGISTGKIHARGPVGLEGLMTYKYKLYGEGQIVGDYADGKRSFHFKDL